MDYLGRLLYACRTRATSISPIVQQLDNMSAGDSTINWADSGELWPGRSGIQEIIPNLCITNTFGARRLPLLLTHKITHIVLCGNELEAAHPAKFEYLKLKGFTDNTHTHLCDHISLALPWIQEALENGGRVLLHCATGSSRSGSIMLAYLIRYHGMSLQAALLHARRLRPIIKPNPGFMEQLLEFERLSASASHEYDAKDLSINPATAMPQMIGP